MGERVREMKREAIVCFVLVTLFSVSVFPISASPRVKAKFSGSNALATPFKPYVAFMHPAVPDGSFVGADVLPLPNCDEQLGLTFTQNFSSLVYNVTVVQQNDTYGYGPAYLLNGVTDKGYWYQVGMSFDWPYTNGSYAAGFNFNYEVWDNSGNSIFPASGGGGLNSFSGPVNNGDNVMLNLYFSSGNVTMYAYDWNTSAAAEATYAAMGASLFQGQTSAIANSNGYLTGLMTEWYHATAYYGGEAEVVYSNASFAVSSGTLWAEEFYLNRTVLFEGSQNVSFSNPTQLQYFTTNSAVEAASGYLFITGGTAPFSASILPSSAIIDVGQQQLFNSSVTGGTSPYTYQWYLDGAVVSGATNATWTFTPPSPGSYTVYVNVTDSVGAQATSNTANVTVKIHDVAVTSITSSKTVIGQGYSLNAVVTAANLGNYSETFNVTLYANTNSIETITVNNLLNATSTLITFTWNTTGFAYGNYTISAYAWPVQGETNTANNNMTAGTVYVGIPGDINGDGTVNILDAIILADAFLSTPGSPNWNPNADINGDGVVNILDAIIQSNNFGATVH